MIDSLSELQLLADTPLRYRRQVLALKQFFASRSCTVMMLDDRTAAGIDLQVRSIAHGVITLEQAVKEYGAERPAKEIAIMARYKPQENHSLLLPVVLREQIVPGSFAFALNYLVDHELDLKPLDAQFKNDEVGASAYDPRVMLKIVLLASSVAGALRAVDALADAWQLPLPREVALAA